MSGAQPDVWERIEVGESEYYALTLDHKQKSIDQHFNDIFRRSLAEGKIQDLLPFGELNG